jgi:hypothetical protein
MEELDAMLRDKNPYALIYKMLRQVLEEEYRQDEAENIPHRTVGMIIRSDRQNLDQRRYNCPTTNEIAVVFKSTDGAPPSSRQIQGHLFIPIRGRKFIKNDTQKPMCDPVTYPLLFPNGDDGWHVNIPYTTTTRNKREQAAAMEVDEEEEVCQPDIRVSILHEREEARIGDNPEEEPESEPDEQIDHEVNDPGVINRVKRTRVTQCEF